MARRSSETVALLAWYRRSRRDLPWRRTRDPYRIWVSEMMLQQTRVEAAIPYYQRFVDEFPTLRDLARAPLDRVLVRWSGLGYYDRARSLHAAVRECAERYQGRVPDDPEAFAALRGVGPYTRAAVLSIAFGRPLAVVDGNVVRVVARLRGLPGHARSPALRRAVELAATALLDPAAPGDFNQALMELGATVCTPRSPRCRECPVAASCAARALGSPEEFPAPAPRPRLRDVTWEAAVVVRRGRVLLVRRGSEGRWKGMWELPWGEGELAEGRSRHGLELVPGPELLRLRHAVLSERITVVVREARLAGRARGPRHAWVAPERLEQHALASVWKKALGALARGAPAVTGRSGRRGSRADGGSGPPAGSRRGSPSGSPAAPAGNPPRPSPESGAGSRPRRRHR